MVVCADELQTLKTVIKPLDSEREAVPKTTWKWNEVIESEARRSQVAELSVCATSNRQVRHDEQHMSDAFYRGMVLCSSYRVDFKYAEGETK